MFKTHRPGTAASGTVVNSGAALQTQGGIAIGAEDLTLNGSGIASDGAFRNISGNNSFDGAITLGSDSMIASDASTLTLNGDIDNGGFLLTASGAGNETTTGIISGLGGLTKTSSGTFTLSGSANNTFTGTTFVTDATLQLSMNTGKSAFGGNLNVGDGIGAANSAVTRWLASNQMPATSLTVNTDGLVDLNNFSDAIGSVTMTSGSVTTGTGTLTLGGDVTGNAASNSATITGNLGLGGNRIFSIADGTAAQDMTISAVISGGFSVTKNGAGTLVFSGANTYTGTTTITSGILNVQSATGLGTTGGGAGTTVSNGGTLQLQGGITVGNESLSISGTGAVGENGALVNVSGTDNYGGLLTLTGATTISADSGTLHLTNFNNITGAFNLTLTGAGTGIIESDIATTTGALIKNGTGTWILSDQDDYTGGTTINAGTLVATSSDSLGAPTGTLTINAGTLEIQSGYSTSRTVTVGDAASTFQIDPFQTYTATTGIGGSGTLNKTGAGIMVLSGVNTYTGGTNVTAGTLKISANDRLADSGALTVSGGTFDLQTFSETVGAVTLSSGAINGGSGGTLTGSSYALQSGTVSAVLAGGGNITKSTAGTVTLTGANTMTGAVTINGGNLTAAAASGNAALGAVSSITVNSGGTLLLGASDQINNSATMTLAGGTFAKGNFSEGTTGAVESAL